MQWKETRRLRRNAVACLIIFWNVLNSTRLNYLSLAAIRGYSLNPMSTEKKRKRRRVTRRPIIYPKIVSFRLSEEYFEKLTRWQEKNPVVGANSLNKLARKLLCDVLAGRVKYKNPNDRLADLDMLGF